MSIRDIPLLGRFSLFRNIRLARAIEIVVLDHHLFGVSIKVRIGPRTR